MKNPAYLYEVSFFSALSMVFPESWKRRVADFYAHHCSKVFEITFVFFEQTQSIKIWSDQVITFYFQIICAIFTLLNPGRKII